MFCFVFHYSTWEKKPQFRCTFPVLRLRIYLQRTVYYNQNATTSWPFTDLKSCHKHKTVTFVDYFPYRFLSVINVYNLKTTENTFHNLVSVNKCFWLSYTMTSDISLGSGQLSSVFHLAAMSNLSKGLHWSGKLKSKKRYYFRYLDTVICMKRAYFKRSFLELLHE